MFPVVLLGCVALMMLVGPFDVPYWVAPAVGGVIATADIGLRATWTAMSPLGAPLLFLVFAVPLAVTLDDHGLFEALAGLLGGRHVVAGLWLLATGVVIVFNLDAAVVLLTPLYIRLAHRHGHPAEALAFQPVLLACLASGLLPVSNLTNLIVAEQLDLGPGDFVRHMAAPTLAACTVGYIAYRRAFVIVSPTAEATTAVLPVTSTTPHGDRRALRAGLPIVGFVLLGFTVGDAVGIPAWVIAAIATLWASAQSRSVRWRSVPVEAIATAAGLAVVVAAALPHLPVDGILGRSGISGRAAALAFGTFGSNATNNLPTVLAGAPSIAHLDQVWPLLVGTNIGPVLIMTGSLSTLLWRETAHRLGVQVSPARYTAIGLRVGLPALLAAAAVVLVVA